MGQRWKRRTGTEAGVARARDRLLSLQREDGHWRGELEADSVLESEYIILLHSLGKSDTEDARRAAREIRRRQRRDGAWGIYPAGPDEVSASVKAYTTLKLMGDSPDAEHMARARRIILDLGGLEATNTYTKIYLALLGLYRWEDCPAIPPEIALLPEWFYFDLYEMSAWSRGIFVPLSLVWAHRPVWPPDGDMDVDELRAAARNGTSGPAGDGPRSDRAETAFERRWRRFFRVLDRALKAVERLGLTPFRDAALESAERWIVTRTEESDGLGAIFPAILNTVMALRCLGYPEDHPLVQRQLAGLEKTIIREDGTLRIEPSLSPVWDTAQAVGALRAAGVPGDHPALEGACSWLLDREVDRRGDWAKKGVEAEPSGWYFQYANEFYPDCDDTAEVLQALGQVDPGDRELGRRAERARERGLDWLLAMQNEDGGWAAFDRGCGEKEILTCIPFADHNAMLDPSCADITGRVLSLLANEGFSQSDAAVRRAVDFLRREQLPDGTWYGRWGCNYIYGTWLALTGLRSVGEDLTEERYRRSVRWLFSVQNDDGGWGERLGTYADPSLKGEGGSTASQTAWALLALKAAGESGSEAASRGVEYLLRTQQEHGGWEDEWWTGTGFPDVFYLRYGYYDDYFPLLALAEFRESAGHSRAEARRGEKTAGREEPTAHLPEVD